MKTLYIKTWELSRLCPETLTKWYVYEFGFWIMRLKVGRDLWEGD
jgi:hypothetical protein